MIRSRFIARRAVPVVVLSLAAIALPPCARLDAQETRATVTGIVTDEQGAVVPGVAVAVVNIDTNVPTAAVTDRRGGFTVPKLQPGRYRITAALEGFKTYVRDGIVLRTAETATVNIPLALGALQERMTVTAGLSEVETNQSTLAQTMENRRVSELPLNGRQVYMLLQQTAGTVFTQTQFGATGFSGTRAWDVNGSVSIHGSRTGNNEFLIDGAAISGTGGWSYAPPVDAIEEFKVQTASTDASYGRTSGGVVNLRLRSGTNDLHGSGTVFYRGTALDANTVQNVRNRISNSDHKYFDWEGMLAGPILQDKTFFMVGYQGFYENIPFPRSSTVPTDLQRLGDFSQTYNSAGQLITIYDPLTTRPDPNRPGRFIRDPIQCNGRINVICPERMNPVALALLLYMPRANAAGDITGANNYINSPNLGFYRYNSYLTRLDHVFGPSHRASLSNSGNWGNERRSENGLPPGPALRSDNWPTQRKSYLATLDDVITLNSSTLLNTRLSFDRFDEPHPKDFGPVETPLPFQTAYQVTPEPWYPHLSFVGTQYTEEFGRPFRQTKNDIYSAHSSISRTAGEHFVKLGAEFRAYRLTRSDLNESNGRFDFNGAFTRRDPQQGDSTSGNAFASFLLGYPDGANSFVDINVSSLRQYLYYGLFVQDDWKIGSKGTLSLGLRWDYQAPVTEKDDKLVVGFDTTSASPLQAPGLQVRGGLLFAGVDGNSRSPYKSKWDNFQPRASVSYKLTDRVIARANYGRSFLPLTGCCQGVIQDGFSQRTPFISSIQTGIPFNTLSRPYPEGFVQPANGSQRLATSIGTGISFVNPNFEPPYADQWMAGVSIELPWNIGLDLAYVGNRVNRLPVETSINEVPYAERVKAIEALGGNASYLSTPVDNPFAGLVPGTFLNNARVNRGQLLRPYPQFTGITETLDNKGWSRYRAFEMVANKRLSKGLAAAVNYTWSRTYEATDVGGVRSAYLNNGYDEKPFEDLASIDRTHHLTITALYDLPLGPGRAIGGNTTGLLATLISGWQFNVIYEYESGTPTAMPNGILRQDSAKLPAGQQTLDHWFDNSTKNNPRRDGGYAWDTLPPNAFRVAPFRMRDVRDPSITNLAFSLFKNMRVGERATLQLRAELFNPFNTRIYGGPNTTITSTQFGKIPPDQINFPRQGQLGIRYFF